jgi:hypothetical protein
VTGLTAAALWLLFGRGNAVAVAAPVPASSSAATVCANLTKAAPKTVNDQSRRTTSPASIFTAAWGDPAITLRCGVPKPTMLVPGTKDYNPSADAAYVNGVAWLVEKTASGYTFTAYQREVYVEVDVPIAYQGGPGTLVDLGPAVLAAVPRLDGMPGADATPAAGLD